LVQSEKLTSSAIFGLDQSNKGKEEKKEGKGKGNGSKTSDGQLRINSKDPENIMNWSAERFKHECQFFHFYTPLN